MDLYLKASLVPGSGKVPPVYDPPPKEGVVWVQNPEPHQLHTPYSRTSPGQACATLQQRLGECE